jgi:transposase
MKSRKVSNLERFFAESFGRKVWVGVDVHKRSYSVAVCRDDGVMVSWKTAADNSALVRQLVIHGMGIKTLVYESGPTGFGLARACRSAGIPAIVAAPSRIIRPVSPTAKTDNLDCRKLAELAAKDMIRSIAVPSEEEEALRALERRRHQLADSQRKVRQRIKGFLLFHGIEEPTGLERWTIQAVQTLAQLPLYEALRDTLDDYLEELRHVRQRILALEKKLTRHTAALHRHRLAYLQSVPGVGQIVACSFLSELFRPERFQRGEEVAAYLGLAPFVRHSGEKSPAGRLRPTGHSRLRSLLVEAAWVWKSRDSGVQAYYTRMLYNTGLAQKAITAVARKLAIVLWRLVCEERVYRPA